MAISITTTDSKITSQDVRKTRNVYDNLDNLKAVVHYDASNNVDYILEASNNSSGKSLENKKLQQIQLDVVETASGITANSATLKARIVRNDNSKVNETGFVYWTGSNEASVIGKTESGTVVSPATVLRGTFSKTVTNLSDNTTYFYRAYIKHEYGTNYSKVYQFTTVAGNTVFAIAGNKFSGPIPLTVSLSAINAGGGVSSYAWNLTGGFVPDFTTQVVDYTYLNTGTFTARASAIMTNGTVKIATKQINATASTNYSSQWSGILSSTYGSNIAGAYDFRNLSLPSLGKDLVAFWKLENLNDSSPNGYNLTNNGNITFEPGKIENAATNNDNNFLTAPLQLNLNDQPYTFAFWIKIESFNGNSAIVPIGKYPGLSINLQGGGSDNRIRLDNFAAAASYSSVSAIPMNTWTHICITIDADKNVKTYFNGQLDAGTGTTNTNNINSICLFQEYNYHNFSGQLDAVGIWNRILTQSEVTALYNDGAGIQDVGIVNSIVGPDLSLVGTTQLESISGDGSYNNVSLLLDMDDSSGPTTFIDKSVNAFTVTVNGNTQIKSITGVGSSAAYFSNTGDYITVANDADLNFNTSDNFTIEGWINFNSLENGVALVSKGSNSTNSGWTLYYYSGELYFGIPYVSNDINGTFSPSLNTWYHLACTRNSGTIRLFLNGVQIASSSENSQNYTSSEALRIGYSHSNNFLNGYVDDVRITKGVARYISNFIPPSGPLPTSSDPNYANVSLLLNMSTAGNTFTDESSNNFTVTVNGNATITSNTPAFSRKDFAQYDGNTSNYLSLNGNSAFNFNNDFTIEGWFLFNENDIGYQPLISSYVSSDQTGWILLTETWNGLCFYGSSGNSWDTILTSNYTPPVGQWLHIAVTRQGSSLQMFVNGVSITSSTGSSNIVSGNTVAIGEYTYFPGGARTFGGYIDDVRVTKGVARYVNNFTPPPSLPLTVGDIVGVKFVPSPAYAVSNETISVTYPHTLVYVGKCDASSAAAETVLLATQPDLNGFNANQVNMVFTRPFQSLMPYNGEDNQQTGYLPDGGEWFYAAFSFLNNNTVRYAVYTPTQTLNGTVNGSSAKENYNGFITFGAGFGVLPQYNVFGTVRAGMFINQAFTTQTDMENLYNDIISGPVTDLGL